MKFEGAFEVAVAVSGRVQLWFGRTYRSGCVVKHKLGVVSAQLLAASAMGYHLTSMYLTLDLTLVCKNVSGPVIAKV